MIWQAWRLQRSTAIALALVAIGIVITAIVTGHGEHSDLLRYRHGPCFGGPKHQANPQQCSAEGDVVGKFARADQFLQIAGFIIGPLVGAILGLFAVASELDSRTVRLAWTQSSSRGHWLAAKVGVGASSAVALLIPVAIALSWWNGMTNTENRMGRFGFELAGWDLVAYGLFMFALTALLGAVIRRIGWTFALAIALYLVVAAVFPAKVRNYLAPVTIARESPILTAANANRNIEPIQSIHIIYGTFPRTDKGPYTQAESESISIRLNTCAPYVVGQTPQTQIKREDACDRKFDIVVVSAYIADDQFWTLQLYEGLIYIGAGALLIAGAYLVLRRVEP